jgi:hypothetical protein
MFQFLILLIIRCNIATTDIRNSPKQAISFIGNAGGEEERVRRSSVISEAKRQETFFWIAWPFGSRSNPSKRPLLVS